MFDKKMIKNLDWVFLILLALLITVSFVVLASASANVSQIGRASCRERVCQYV